MSSITSLSIAALVASSLDFHIFILKTHARWKRVWNLRRLNAEVQERIDSVRGRYLPDVIARAGQQ